MIDMFWLTTLLFWLSTLVPGFAILQWFFPQDLRRGLLASLSWSYVLTAALMAPIVAVAFTVHLSVQTVGTLYLTFVLVGIAVIVRSGGAWRFGRLLRSTWWFEVGLILVAVALTAPLGGFARADSFPHSAKVRFIRDVGFYLQDPYSPLEIIETKWHVNVQHGLFAIASWLTGSEPLDLWFGSAWFFRLLAIGAVEFLGTTIFRSRWLGAISMLGAVAVLGTKMTIVMPFSVSAFAICPILVALVVDLLERPSALRYAKVLACSVGLAIVHVGTWFLAVLCIAPMAAAWLIWQRGLKQAVRTLPMAAAVLATGVPLLLVSALQPNYVAEQQDELHVRMIRTIELTRDWSITIIDPTHYAWMLPMIAALVLLAVVGRHFRQRVLMLAAIMCVAMVCMFTPGIFDLLVMVIPYWLVQRFRYFGEIIALVMVSAGLAWMSRPRLTTRLARAAMSVLVLCGGLAAFRTNLLGYVQEASKQPAWLQGARELQDTVKSVIPPHSLVAADPQWSLELPTVHLARVLGADLHHANPADGGLVERYADAQELLAASTSVERRREIVAKHGVKFMVVRDEPGSAPGVDFDDVGRLVASKHHFRVYRVGPEATTQLR